MLKNALNRVVIFYRQHPVTASILAAILVITTDFFTGKYIRFPIVYVLPVGMAAWGQKRGVAILLSILLPLARLVFHFPWHVTQSLSSVSINTPIRMAALLLYAILIARTSRQSMELEKEVKQLEGILPICASCKRIRNESGVYVNLESYITTHSQASFSHGLCPDCVKKMYPDFDF